MDKHRISPGAEVCVFWKKDGSAHDPAHDAHKTFISAQQIHGNGIWSIPKNHDGCGPHSIQADALFSLEKTPIGIYVADCLPLVLIGNHAHAIVHGSRKTLHGGLLQDTLDLFHMHNDIVVSAWLWPCIKWYEVGEEFDNYFPEQFLQPYGEKYLFDLPWYALSILHARWIPNEAILMDPWCTRNDTHTYRSYRRGDVNKRNFIGVKKA